MCYIEQANIGFEYIYHTCQILAFPFFSGKLSLYFGRALLSGLGGCTLVARNVLKLFVKHNSTSQFGKCGKCMWKFGN